ncbi:MAG: hypothetical protein V4441_07000 [Pseudomonadota bacterium]
MLTLDSYAEKSFELWPGALRFAASGPDAHAAVAAGLDAAREIADSLMSDADLMSRGSFDILPRGLAARQALDMARSFGQALGATAAPPLLVALPGAVCDDVMRAMRHAGKLSFAVAVLGDALAFHVAGVVLPSDLVSLPLIMGEFVQALGPRIGEGGVALAGAHRHFPTSGVADLVAVQSDNAAQAALAAAALSDACLWPSAKKSHRSIADPFVARAYEARARADATGLMPPEDVWETLSKGVKRASVLREKRQFHAAAFGLKGRGRIVGPLGGDRLLRFGVSEWR